MDDRQLIADLLSALEYHTEQTRPIEFSNAAIQAAREHLRKPAQRKPLTDEHGYLIGALRTIAEGTYDVWSNGAQAQRTAIAAIEKYEAAHGIKENT